MTTSAPHLEAGAVIAGYRIDAVAGQGGMGVVYRAWQLGLDRPVALKLIASELAGDDDFRRRFKTEAQLAAAIDHPNVVPIFESGDVDGLLYLAMRLVEGADLRTLVEADGGLEPERAVLIVRQVAGALDAAHRRGLVHRDVKPPNVLIASGEDEHVYLTDFGLTKHAAAASGFTRTGLFVGTPDFAAPEQIRGEHADARADIYALGCLLFHALTGRVPFPRDSELAKMYAHLNDPAPAASAIAPAVPAALDAVIGTALAKDPGARYASAGDLGRAAWAALQGEPAPSLGGSVAIGDAAEQPAAVRDTPAPAPVPAAISEPQPSSAATPAPAPPVPPVPPRVAGPAGWPRGRRIALLVALPCLLAAALGVAALGASGGFGGGADDAAPQARERQAAAAPPAAGQARVVRTVHTGDGPDGVAVDGDKVLVSHARAGTLIRLDAKTGKRVDGPVPVGRNPDQIATGKGTVWVVDASGDKLQRLQTTPRLQPTATIPIGHDAQGISLGEQLAWVANTGDDTVQRIDRAQAEAVGDPIGVGDHPLGIHVGSKVWVTNFRDGTLQKIDIATAQVEGAPLRTGNGARGVDEGFGAVWVSNLRDDTVVRVDPETFKVVARIAVGKEPKELVANLGSVWVVNSGSNSVTRIDPDTNRVSGAPIPVGSDPLGIAATGESLWVTNFGDDTVSEIKP